MFRLASVLAGIAILLSPVALGVAAATFAVMARIALFFLVAAVLLCLVYGKFEHDWLTS